MTLPANGNGHRRRQLRARVLAEESHCALCGLIVDKALTVLAGQHSPRCTDPACGGCVPDPLRPEVDEDLPRSRGGSPYDRANCRLMHRRCNQAKRDRTLAESRAALNDQQQHTSGPTITNLVAW